MQRAVAERAKPPWHATKIGVETGQLAARKIGRVGTGVARGVGKGCSGIKPLAG